METSAGSRLFAGVIGTACLLGGAVMTLRPFEVVASLVVFVAVYLAVSGLGDIIEAQSADRPWGGRIAGGSLVAAGILALAWPDATVRVIAFIAGIGMIIDGAVRLAGFDGAGDVVGGRLRAIAGLTLGVLALVWPTATVLVVAALFGIRTMVIGVGFLFGALAPEGTDTAAPNRSVLTGARGVGVVLVVGVALAGTSAAVHG